MNRIFTLLLVVGCTWNSIAEIPITDDQKLFATARIWGFLKYYHPEVAKGTFDWDQQLFSFLEKTKSVATKEGFSAEAITWIESLGTVRPCASCAVPSTKKSFDKNFDLSWTQDAALFTPALSKKLKFIENNRHLGPSYYAGSEEYSEVFREQNEARYAGDDWSDRNVRLITLFRFWNQIEYFFPYKYMTDTKWSEVLRKSIPVFRDAADETAYKLATLSLVSAIDDSHATLFTPATDTYFGDYWVPAAFKIVEGKAYIERFYDPALAAANGLEIGDVVEEVDGKSVNDVLEGRMPYLTGSNRGAKLRGTRLHLYNGATDSVTLTIERNGKRFRKTVGRYLPRTFKNKPKATEKTPWKTLDGGIGYVDFGALKYDEEKVGAMMVELMKKKAIIFDIRNYPDGVIGLISPLLNREQEPFAQFIRPDFDYPGKFFWSAPETIGPDKKGEGYNGKVILLVNENTQSHAEFTAMALQTAPDVTTIGSQTSGADGNVSEILLPGDHKTRFSALGVFYPDGTETQRKGVRVDIEVKPTIKGLREGRDEVLDRAIEEANKQP